jgi:hypothetical protein
MVRTFFRKIIFFVLLLAIGHSTFPYRALANGGPEYRVGAGTGFYEFDENSGIELTEETVTFDYVNLPNKVFYANYGLGNVTVIYKLKNKTNSDKNFNMLFITPDSSYNYSAYINGKKVKTEEIFNVVPSNWTAEFGISNAKGYKGESIKVRPGSRTIRVPIDIKANDSVQFEIIYNSQTGTYSGRGIVNQEFYEVYYLTPAKFWEGQPKVNLRINFPNNKKFAVTSNIPLSRISGSSYRANLKNLPNNEWMFYFSETTNLIFGTNNQFYHNLLTIISVILLSVIILMIQMKYNKRWIIPIVYPIIFMFFIEIFYMVGDSGYINIILRPLISIFVMGILIVLYKISVLHTRRDD